jgi:hypothetical protein
VLRDLNFTELVITVVPKPAVPSTPSNGTSSGGGTKKAGLSYSEKIGLGIGLGIGLPAIIAVTLPWCLVVAE